ncbi:MAG: FAD binding domain-containing protein, partial [Anaerolineales bacterium]
MGLWNQYDTPTNLDEAINLLAEHAGEARIVAGATDIILEIEREIRPDVKRLIDITRIPGLDEVNVDGEGWVHLGPLVTHNHIVASD